MAAWEAVALSATAPGDSKAVCPPSRLPKLPFESLDRFLKASSNV